MSTIRWPAASAVTAPSASVPSRDAGSAPGESPVGATSSARPAASDARTSAGTPPKALRAPGDGGWALGASPLRSATTPAMIAPAATPAIAARRPRTRLQPRVAQPVGVRAEHRDRAGLEDRDE